MKRNLRVGTAFAAVLGTLGIASVVLERSTPVEAAATQAPRFEVDLMWPKPLPNHWVIGQTIGVSVDAQDHVWIIHRAGALERMETYSAQTPPASECCSPAPPVLEFDQEGTLIGHWGGQDGPGYEWPASNHGITVDYKGNVWIGGNGRTRDAAGPEEAGNAAPGAAGRGGGGRGKQADKQGDQAKGGGGRAAGGPPLYHDSMVLKFTQDGKFLLAIGKAGASQGSNDIANLGLPAKTFVDPKTNELYVADGYGNKRVIVYDAETGKYKRHWGAYGHVPDDANIGPYRPGEPPAQQFRNPVHCAELSHDDLLYVCDRKNDRIQVFKPDGTFIKEQIIAPNTLGDGSAWDIAFSKDPQQKYMYLVDGSNEKIYVMLRDTLEILTSFGDGGRQPGQFYAVHSIATDSKGNLYTTETYRGQRVQRFLYKGLAAVTKKDQGVVWPAKK
jgi:hypothetical protein